MSGAVRNLERYAAGREKEIAHLRARIERLENALSAVLPMALGYAADHPVGRNQEIANAARDALVGTR